LIEVVAALKNRQQLHVSWNNRIYYGANQSWLDSNSKQEDGCASVCVFNLLQYNSLKIGYPKLLGIPKVKGRLGEEQIGFDMATLYDYIQPLQLNRILPQGIIHKKIGEKYEIPSSMGIFNQHLLTKRINSMCSVHNDIKKPIVQKKLIYSKDKIMDYVNFISSNLSTDLPVLCLNTFAKAQFYVSGSFFESDQNECDKLEKMSQMKKTSFVTHWVLITGIYFVGKKPVISSGSEGKREWLIQCSTWGDIAYFYLEDLVNLSPLLQVLFPPCLTTYQWE